MKDTDDTDDNNAIAEITPDFTFVDDIFVKIAKKEEEKGAKSLDYEQQVLGTIWHIAGIVEGGGLSSFLERNFDVEEAARAYETVGMAESAAILRKTLSIFPYSRRPASSQKLLKFIEEHEEFLESLSNKFLRREKNLEKALISYIEDHPAAFKEFMD
jgi:hypothetical protein